MPRRSARQAPAPIPPAWSEIDAAEAAELFGSPPPAGVPDQCAAIPATPRMREAARRRARDESRNAPSTAELAGTTGPLSVEIPCAATEPPPAPLPLNGAVSLIAMQRDVLRGLYAHHGITRESYAAELVATARSAAAEGDYSASANLYKLIGQHIGALDASDKHVHFHQSANNQPGGSANPTNDYRSASDDALRSLIQRAKDQDSIQDSLPAPVIDEFPAPAGDPPTEAE